ncbi:MAG: response regulator [Elusimicrobiota bacterium]
MSTILVIDDDKGYGPFLNDYLGVMGFSACVVATGDAGLEFTKTVRPDLILLDWCLKKGFSAEETLRLFKSQPGTQGVPVVVISGIRVSAEDEMGARRAGAAQFITKNEITDSPKALAVFKRRLEALILDQSLSAGKPRAAAMKKPALARAIGRILLVDDDQDMRDMVSLFLREKGYTVLTAETGALGLSKAREESPDLVVLDLGLPDMDGLEVCAQLKAWPRTRPIPVLILTARSSRQAQLLAVEYSADHYLSKPLPDLDQFHNWVSALLRRKSHLVEPKGVLRVGDALVIDITAHTVNVQDRCIDDLPATLFQLLCEFARRPGEILSRDYLLLKVWNNSVLPHHVTTAVNRLKKRVGKPLEDWLVCVPDGGYRLIPDAGRKAERPRHAEPPASSENA